MKDERPLAPAMKSTEDSIRTNHMQPVQNRASDRPIQDYLPIAPVHLLETAWKNMLNLRHRK